MKQLFTALLVASVLAAAAAASPSTSTLLEVRSVLTGVVLEDGLVRAGARVVEGQPLVYVRIPLVGATAVAAQAPRDGMVRQVLVQAGQRVAQGDVVARIEVR